MNTKGFLTCIIVLLINSVPVFGQPMDTAKDIEEEVVILNKRVKYLELVANFKDLATDMELEALGNQLYSMQLELDMIKENTDDETISMLELLYLSKINNKDSDKAAMAAYEKDLSLAILLYGFTDEENNVLTSALLNCKTKFNVLDKSLDIFKFNIDKAKELSPIITEIRKLKGN